LIFAARKVIRQHAEKHIVEWQSGQAGYQA